MPTIRVSASAAIPAPAEAVYDLLADYRDGHPAVLPQRYFTGLAVERGGRGAGTVIRFGMRSFGRTRTIRAEITEPEPGRVLAERDLATGALTRFIVEPAASGAGCRVTITTEWATPGLTGWIERLAAPSFLRRVYLEELANLARVATMRGGGTPRPAGAAS